MHRKLAFVLAVLAMVIGSASEVRAAVPPAAASGVTRALRPAVMLGRGRIGATWVAASQHRMAQHRGLRMEAHQRSLPGRVTPATVSGTMIQPAQPGRPDVPTSPFTAYVTNPGSGTVTPITTATNTADTPITVGNSPQAIAITPDGTTAYVGDVGSGTVTPITTATNTAGTPITTGSEPYAVAITPDGTTAYVANFGSGTVTPITTATNTAGTPIKVGTDPIAIAITPDGTTAYVINNESGTVTPITTATNTAGTPITVGSDPIAIAITPDGKTAYITNYFSGTVTPITTATNTAGTPITVGSSPGAITITRDGATAYVSAGNYISGTVTPITTATNTAGTPITVGNSPGVIAISPDGKTAYVVNEGSGTVTPIRTATNTADSPITVGSNPHGIAITPDGTTAYVANFGSGTVTPITTATNTAGTPIPVGSDPDWIAIAPIPPLAAPSGLAAAVAGPASGPPSGVVLTWTDNATAPAATLARVERASNPGFSTDVTSYTTGAADITYTDTAVIEGATYYYRVRAENDSTTSAWSNPVSITFTTVPAAPGGLTATVTGPLSGPPAGVTLNWTNPADGAPVTQLMVRRATDPGFTTGLTTFTLGATATTYTDTAVVQGVTYYYQVQAQNEVSNSAWSNTASIVFTTVPAAPSGLTATVIGPVSGPPTAVTLTWTDTTGGAPDTQLVVRRATDPGFTTGLTTFTLGATATTYTDTAVVQGTTYYYQVQAQNEVSNSAWSAPVSVTFPTVPAAPSGLTATVIGPVSGPPAGVSLTWTDPAAGVPATQMVVQRATDPGFTTGLTTFTLGATATTYTDTEVAQGTTYYYQVQAENEVSNSSWSNTASITFTTVPAAPSGLTATVTGPLSGPPTGVALTWTDPAAGVPATQMVVQRATDPGFTTGLTTFTLGATATTYTDTEVAQGTTYYYQVQAQNEVSNSAWSAPVSVTFPTVPAAPSGLTATVIGPVSGPPAGVTLTWTDPRRRGAGHADGGAAGNQPRVHHRGDRLHRRRADRHHVHRHRGGARYDLLLPGASRKRGHQLRLVKHRLHHVHDGPGRTVRADRHGHRPGLRPACRGVAELDGHQRRGAGHADGGAAGDRPRVYHRAG